MPLNLVTARPIVAAALTVGLLASCGGTSDPATPAESPSGPPTPTTTPEPTPEPTVVATQPRARAVVRRAVRNLVTAGTGSYVVDVDLGRPSAVHDEGRYQVEPSAWDATRHTVTADGVSTIAYRSIGSDTWFRLVEVQQIDGTGPGAWRCWAHIADSRGLADELGVPISRGQPPAALVAASYAAGDELVDPDSTIDLGNVRGTTDLVSAMGLLGAKAVAATSLDPSSDATTPAYFTVHRGVLHGYEIGLDGLFDAVVPAGGTLPPGLTTADAVPGHIEVTFADLGQPVRIDAPPADQVVELTTDDAAFERQMKACSGV